MSEALFKDVLEVRAAARKESPATAADNARLITGDKRLGQDKLALLYTLLNPETSTSSISHSFNHSWSVTGPGPLLAILGEAKTIQDAIQSILPEVYKTTFSPDQQEAVLAKINLEYSATRCAFDRTGDPSTFKAAYKDCYDSLVQYRNRSKSWRCPLLVRYVLLAGPPDTSKSLSAFRAGATTPARRRVTLRGDARWSCPRASPLSPREAPPINSPQAPAIERRR